MVPLLQAMVVVAARLPETQQMGTMELLPGEVPLQPEVVLVVMVYHPDWAVLAVQVLHLVVLVQVENAFPFLVVVVLGTARMVV